MPESGIPSGPTASYPGDPNDWSQSGWTSQNTDSIISGIAALGSSAFQFASAFTTGQNVNPQTGQPYYLPGQQPPVVQQPQNNTLIYIVIIVVVLMALLAAAYFFTKAK